jgi:hypothetical protein
VERLLSKVNQVFIPCNLAMTAPPLPSPKVNHFYGSAKKRPSLHGPYKYPFLSYEIYIFLLS